MRSGLQSHASRLRWSVMFAVALLMPLSMGVRGCERTVIERCAPNAANDGGVCTCEYDGDRYAAGAQFKSHDGCNDCTCQQDGSVLCTLRACPDTCGGLQGAGCPDGQYCDFPVDAQCGAADATGTCRAPSEVCPDIYRPVCGCDDKTYSSACVASRAGVAVAAQGPCGGNITCAYAGKQYAVGDSFASTDGCNTCSCTDTGRVVCTLRACKRPQVCGGLGGAQCVDGDYCSYAAEANCGYADATGTCEAKPQVCPTLVMPVCGCDDKTYANACEAARAGVSVQVKGECP